MSNTKQRPKSEVADTEREAAVGFHHSAGLPELLRALNLSLIVTTYQAQRVFTFAPNGDRLSMLMRIFERPTWRRPAKTIRERAAITSASPWRSPVARPP